jgi:hypothetical protein
VLWDLFFKRELQKRKGLIIGKNMFKNTLKIKYVQRNAMGWVDEESMLFRGANHLLVTWLSGLAAGNPHNTGQSHGCLTDVVLGHSKHPSNIHWTARHPHRRSFRGRKNVRRPTQIGADGHPRFIIPDINMTFLGFDFAFRNKY